VRRIALIAAAAILLLQMLAVAGLAGRPLHYDENEYLHASWLMAAGRTIYRDFFEDHPPHLGLLLHAVMPGGDLHAIDVRAWAVRSRVWTGAFGTLAVAMVMLFAWRMTRAPAAPLVAGATLLASSQLWSRGLADIRAEAPTLALFWSGIVLLTWSVAASRAQAWRAGAGIGLMFFAAVWNPKWPLESALAGAYFLWWLWRSRRFEALGPAALIAFVAVLPLFTVTTFRDYLFFNFQLKGEVVDEFLLNPWIVRFFEQFPVWTTAAPQHRWWWIVAAIVLGAIGTWSRERRAEARPTSARLAWIALALATSALLEFRFVYPYPYLWAQYLVMVATTAALAYALLSALLPERVQLVVFVAAMIWAIVPLQRKAFGNDGGARYWATQRAIQTSLRPGETVWISPPRHPVAALDASYYWYNFRESAPLAIGRAQRHPEFLPPLRFEELPPCHLRARYVEIGDWIPYLEGVCRCVERNHARLSPTPALGIFEVDGPRREVPWHQRTYGLWTDLCRRQEIFLRGGQLNIAP
jgi:hypothetical protein